MDLGKLIERAKNICLSPKTEWPKIADEPATTQSLFVGYAIILAAIPAICGFIGMTMVGMTMPMVGTIRIPIGTALVSGIIGYVLGLVGIFVLALIIDALAPTFDGQKSSINALKVAVYTYTPMWLIGILSIIPMLSMLSLIAALYAIYLLYIGLPVLMKCPTEKSVGYTALVIVCALVLAIIIAFVVGLLGMGAGLGAMR
ncbi:MAG: Yip1 family protein [Casimicrobium sp.]